MCESHNILFEEKNSECFRKDRGSGRKEDGITEWWREMRSEEQNNMTSKRKIIPRKERKGTERK
jgi:hypothetical protein